MPNQLDITAAQAQATQRHDLYGVVYLLSGTLSGRAPGVADAPFYWSTANVAAPLGVSGADINFEAYLSPPTGVRRALSFDPRTGPSTPAIRVPVYNLAFAHAQTLLAAITDNDFSWENTRATLRVGYLKPGQSADDLAAEDWTPLVLDGFFGAPQDIQLDGFNLVLYGRGANRNQAIMQGVVGPPASDPLSSNGKDKADIGRPFPIVVGRPDSWFKLPTSRMHARGLTVSGYSAGDTVIQIQPLTSGFRMMKTGGATNATRVHVHYRLPLYELTSGFADVIYDPDTNLLTFTLASGLAADVPRGAYVQERDPLGYTWSLADYRLLFSSTDLDGAVGFRFADGRIVTADLARWPFEINTIGGGPMDNVHTLLFLDEGSVADPSVPVFFEPFDPNAVAMTQQAAYTSTLTLTSKLNYGTGGAGGTNNSFARDGNDSTAMTLTAAEVATITFNDAPAPFANDDTTASTLHIIKGTGALTLTNSINSITFANVPTAAGTYRFAQGAARDFNETIRIVGGGAGGSVAEIWWEHDASTQDTTTRTADAAVGTGVSGEVGEAMQFAEVVFRMPRDTAGSRILEEVLNAGGSLVANPWLETKTVGGHANQPVGRPAAAMAGLQSLLLGAEGRLDSIAQDAYTAAHAQHQAENIRWNFVILDPINSWTELEQQLAVQTRTNMFYGPSGHEMVFQETASGFEQAAVRRDFRLESVPGANTAAGNGPLVERTMVSDIRNRVVVDYAPDYTNNREPQASQERSNAASVALFGERADPRGRFSFWAHSADTGNPFYDVDVSVSGIAQSMADRYAFAQTRFRFRTAWIAHGLDRGSVVRVAYRVGDQVYRNVRCEVEDIKVFPTDTEQVELVCRSVGTPKRGFAPAFTWADVFSVTDGWSSRIASIDRWEQYWDL